MTVRVVIADDQTSIREALATMLDLIEDISVVGTAANGESAIEEVRRTETDVVLMDLRMPGIGGVEATARLQAQFPDIPVVVLTTFADDDSILGALGAGASGYLTKDAGRHEIAAALRAAVAGQSVLDKAVQARLLAAARPGRQETPVSLTPRETEVLRLIAGGLSNREIADALFVGEATVKTHINNLFAKAGLRDRAQAVHYAFTNGLVG